MPKSRWIMLILSCLMIAGGIFYWQNHDGAPAPELVRAVPAGAEEEWIAATEPLQVNINTADLKELEKLPGIGPGKAAAIIRFRQENGPFRNTEELMLVPGIKEATYAKLKDYVVVWEKEAL